MRYFILVIGLSFAFSDLVWANDASFHAPVTPAEKVLDTILARANQDDNLFEFILKRPWYDPAKGSGYENMFSRTLLDEWARAEASMVKESCDGVYREGEICGIDYDPISCSQDPPDAYTYRTKIASNQRVVIASMAPYSATGAVNYVFVKTNGKWKLDGVDCGDGVKFNIQ